MKQPYNIPSVWSPEAAVAIEENFTKLYAFTEQVSGLKVVNGDTVTLWKGCAVYLSGGDGQLPVVLRARANADTTMPCIGLVKEPILPGEGGLIIQEGMLELNTSGFAQDNALYVSSTDAGQLTATAPSSRGQEVATVVSVGEFGSVLVQVEAMSPAHNLLSATHLDTTAATVVRGDLITGQGATPTWARLAISATAGRFARTDGTDVGWSTLALPNAATTGDVLYASAANTMSQLTMAAVGNALISGGAGVAPSWGKVNLTTGASQHVTGTLPVANGGTGLSSMVGAGRMLASDGSTSLTTIATTFNNRIILSQGTTAVPVWSDFSVPTSAVLGDIWYGSDSTTISRLAINTTATRYLANTGVSSIPAWDQVNLTNGVTGILPYANGGTNASTAWTQGSIFFAGASAFAQDNANFFWDDTANRLGIGTAAPDQMISTSAATVTGIHLSSSNTDTSASSVVRWQCRLDGSFGDIREAGALEWGKTADWTTASTSDSYLGIRLRVNDVAAEWFRFEARDNEVRWGLGTNAPSTTLHAKGDATAAQDVIMRLEGVANNSLGAILLVAASLTADNATGYIQGLDGTTASTQITFLRSGGANSGAINFRTKTAAGALTTNMTLSPSGVLGIGTATFPTTGTAGLVFGDGTALATMGLNTAGFYADDVGGTVMMQAISEAGTVTRLNHVNRALGAGAAATLGNIGGSGPTVAAQNSWMEYQQGGTTYWIPVWV